MFEDDSNLGSDLALIDLCMLSVGALSLIILIISLATMSLNLATVGAIAGAALVIRYTYKRLRKW